MNTEKRVIERGLMMGIEPGISIIYNVIHCNKVLAPNLCTCMVGLLIQMVDIKRYLQLL